jgi:hypothetical protein
VRKIVLASGEFGYFSHDDGAMGLKIEATRKMKETFYLNYDEVEIHGINFHHDYEEMREQYEKHWGKKAQLILEIEE